jgi:hypothetical protein
MLLEILELIDHVRGTQYESLFLGSSTMKIQGTIIGFVLN